MRDAAAPFVIAALLVLLFLYGVPGLILLVTKRANRIAAWLVLVWSLGPLAASIGAFILYNYNPGPLLIGLFPTALLDLAAGSRLMRAVPPSETGAPATVAASPIPHLIPIWIGIELIHSIYGLAVYPLTYAHFNFGASAMQTVAIAVSALGWLLLGSLQWLVLKKVGVEQTWIGATFAVGTLARYAARSFEHSFSTGLWIYALVAVLTAVVLSIAQWFYLPKRFIKRSIWLYALPSAELAASLLWLLWEKYDFVSSRWQASLASLAGALLVGALTGLAMRRILSVSAAPEAPAAGIEPAI